MTLLTEVSSGRKQIILIVSAAVLDPVLKDKFTCYCQSFPSLGLYQFHQVHLSICFAAVYYVGKCLIVVKCVENPAMPVRLRLLWIDSHFTAHHSLVRWECNTLFTRLNDDVQSSLKYSPKSIFASLCSSNAVVYNKVRCLLEWVCRELAN